MLKFFDNIFNSENFMPHGLCLLWDPGLVWLHMVSDFIIGVSYYSIPLAALYYITQAKNIKYKPLYILFVIFILACGTTHFFAVWTLFIPNYGWEGIVKAITALTSLPTAVILWFVLPELMLLPTYGTLEQVVKEKDIALEALREETQARMATEQKLREAQKFEAVGQIAGGVAHDFNNLLQIVVLNNELWQRRLPKDAPIQTSLTNNLAACAKASILVDRLLSYARKQALMKDYVPINKVINEITPLIYNSIGKEVILKLDLYKNLMYVRLDEHQLQDAIINLINNAKDSLPNEKGQITIRTLPETVDKRQYYRIDIIDTGEGIPESILDKVYDPFFTTKPQGKGTGLGLSQVYGFAQQSNGFVKINSKVGEGTTVSVYLPWEENNEE